MPSISSIMLDSIVTSNTSQLKTNSSASDFSSYMDSSKSNSSNDVSNVSGKSDSVKVSSTRKLDAKDDSVSSLNSQDVSDNAEANVTKDTLDTVSDKIEETVKDALGIDDETLANAMTSLGLTALDLLNPMNLQQLVVTINGSSDMTDLLTNETMMQQLSNLTDALSAIDWQELTGMSKEDFMSALEQAMNPMEQGDLMSEMSDGEVAHDIPVEIETVADDVPVVVQQDDSTNVTKNSDATGEQDTTETNVISDDTSITTENQNETSSDNSDLSDEVASQQTTTDDTVDVQSENQAASQTDFIQNLDQAIGETTAAKQAQPEQMQQMIDIVNQVVEKIKVSLGTDSTSMELQLNPENLGKVILNVAAKDGVMTANFTVQSEEARMALESQMYTLKENLEARELKVDAVEVQVSDFAFSQSGQNDSEDQKNSDNGNGKRMKFEFDEEEESNSVASDEEETARVRRSVMRDSGTQVDFTA